MQYIQYKSFYTDNILLPEQKQSKSQPILNKDKQKKCGVSCPGSGCWFILVSLSAILSGGLYLAFDPIVKLILLNKSVLRNDTASYRAWKSPPISPHMKVFFFNLTNAPEVFAGTDKPNLTEIGPYTYLQEWNKQNLTWNHNGTVTYRNRKIFRFSPKDSCEGCDDVADNVTTLNIVAISAYHQKRDSYWWIRNPIEALVKNPWMTVSPAELLWGYEDPLYKVSKAFPDKNTPPFDKFGIFAEKNISTEDLLPSMTMLTGETDPYLLSRITRLNGQSHLTHWNNDTQQCNQIKGSSGASFGPFKKENETLWLFDKQMCRAIPFSFQHRVQHQGLQGLRFKPRRDVFMSASFPSENSCFNGSDLEFGDGVYDISPCQYNAPIVLSWPHFLNAEDKYQAGVTGLSPDLQKHETYFDVEPVSGSTMRAKARIQVNMAVRNTDVFNHLKLINDTLVPILWFEEGIDGLNEDLLKMLYSVTVEIQIYKKLLLSFILIMCGIDCILIIIICGKRVKKKMYAAKLESIFTNLSLVLPGHPGSMEPRLLAYSDSQGTSVQASRCHSRNPSDFTNQVIKQK